MYRVFIFILLIHNLCHTPVNDGSLLDKYCLAVFPLFLHFTELQRVRRVNGMQPGMQCMRASPQTNVPTPMHSFIQLDAACTVRHCGPRMTETLRNTGLIYDRRYIAVRRHLLMTEWGEWRVGVIKFAVAYGDDAIVIPVLHGHRTDSLCLCVSGACCVSPPPLGGCLSLTAPPLHTPPAPPPP